MRYKRHARPTLTATELHHGEVLEFVLADGSKREIAIDDSGAAVIHSTCGEIGVEQAGAVTTYRFWCDLRIDGHKHRLEREVGTQRSFYEPWEIAGVRLWLDAVDAIFAFMQETHGPCRLRANCAEVGPPRRHVRLGIQDSSLRICPEPVFPWCPLPPDGLRMEMCYRGEDCWLGAYHGASAHAGLDINQPSGSPLYAPINLDDQFLYNSVALGQNNNRWRGIRRWPDGAEWVLRTAHMTELTVPERVPLMAGQQYARGAGVRVGVVEHSHFGFEIHADGETIPLDAWVLFWQMYQDRAAFGNWPTAGVKKAVTKGGLPVQMLVPD
jgi:hypothetical protein